MAVEGDALADIDVAVSRVKWVMEDGTVVVGHASMQRASPRSGAAAH